MDVAEMNKTNSRLAVTGIAILLGACAIALAQHDSRKRERDTALTSQQTQSATPISAPEGFSASGVAQNSEIGPASGLQLTPEAVVRGNDGRLSSYTPQMTSEAELSSGDAVVPAAAEEAAGNLYSLPTLGSGQTPDASAVQGGQVPSLPSMGSAADAWNGDASGPSPALMNDTSGVQTVDGLNQSLPSLGGESGLGGEYGAGSDAVPGYSSASSGGLPSIAATGRIDDVGTENVSNENAGGSNQLPSGPTAGEALSSTGGFDASQSGYGDGRMAYGAAGDDTTSRGLPANNPSPAAVPQALAPVNPLVGAPAQTGYPDQSSYEGATEYAGPGVGIPSNNYQNSNRSVSALPASNATAGQVAMTASSGLGQLTTDVPGNRYLDGVQRPDVAIEVRAPGPETQVGKNAVFVIAVSNRGSVDALDVTVVNRLPRGTRFVTAEPMVSPAAGGILVWQLGRIPAGEERLIRMTVVPEVEGEIGSTASVMFATQASARTLATQPKLELAVEASPNVLIGDQQNMVLVVRNSGSGVARNVALTVDVPENLSHPSGASIEAKLADLHPNESRRIDNLSFQAIQAGVNNCVVRILTEDGTQAEEVVPIDVRAPRLIADIRGPSERYLQREATYEIAVANAGNATATNLEFAVHLPAGLAYVSSENPAVDYDRARHAVYVALPELAPQGKAPLRLNLLPVEIGEQSISVKTTGDLGIVAEASTNVKVNGRAELEFTIAQDAGRIEVGATTTYEVRILNKGDMPDQNVTLAIELPQGSTIVDVFPKVGYQESANGIQFAPIQEMPVRESRTFRFVVRHSQNGTRVIRSRVFSENLKVGVLKEIPTFVYADGQ
ncbi:MAG TPA: hypothetical protein DDW52_19165 [Planctomycetaceae bacterium]|nr:hypothetical protein [Planctomycetaceae bacterium]